MPVSLIMHLTLLHYTVLAFAHISQARYIDQDGWGIVAAEAEGTALFTIALHQPRLAEAESLLEEISNPKSGKFGQFLKRNELDTMFAPTQDSIRVITDWLSTADVDTRHVQVRPSRGVVEVPISVHQLEKLVGIDSRILEHRETGVRRLESPVHTVPRELRTHVEMMWSKIPSASGHDSKPRSDLDRPKSHATKVLQSPAPVSISNCSLSWTPACIRELYNIPLGTEAAPNNSLGIFGAGDAYQAADLSNFFSKLASFIPNGTKPSVDIINGAPPTPGEEIQGEQILDLSMAYPIAYPQNIHIFQNPGVIFGSGLGNNFLDAVDSSYCHYDGGDDPNLDPQYPQFQGFQGPAMCGVYNITNVLSISFATDESLLGIHYVQRQCHEWMKLALQGVTVLVASGDTGVQGNMGCSASQTAEGGAFNPLFPSVCPYVTTVGATQVNVTKTGYREVAVYDPKHNFYSGGGFSNFNTQPKYQAEAVKNYLSKHDPKYPEGTFNKSGRAFPDVSMLGANVTISDNMGIVQSGGTSAATPLFAALISRINDERLLAGKGPIGFLNRILYQHPEVFTDITDGSNPGCGTSGFQAAKGWDPVSGLGSPDFSKLRSLLVNLP